MRHSLAFRLLGDNEKAAVDRAVARAWAEWAAEWFASPPTPSISVGDACEVRPGGDWQVREIDRERWVAVRIPASSLRQYAGLLFDTDVPFSNSPSILVQKVLDDCIDDLLIRLVPEPNPMASRIRRHEAGALDELRIDYGSGAALAVIAGAPAMEIAIGGEWCAALSRERGDACPVMPLLSPRESAVGNGVLRLEVLVGQGQMALGELTTLAVGDVIRLDARYNEAMCVQTSDGVPLFRANLGADAAYKAILLTEKFQ